MEDCFPCLRKVILATFSKVGEEIIKLSSCEKNFIGKENKCHSGASFCHNS